MELTREILDRFVDGELSPQEMEQVVRLLAAHPEHRVYVERQERLRQKLRAHFLALEGATPERLIQTARTAPISWRWHLRRLLSGSFVVGRLVPASAALVLGVIIGLVLKPGSDFVSGRAGSIVAGSTLAETLDNQLASAESGTTRIGISFRNKQGQDCRTFSSGETAGLACHDKDGWVVERLIHARGENANAAYRMAGSAMPDALRQAVQATIRGEPFDRSQEAKARAQGWQGSGKDGF